MKRYIIDAVVGLVIAIAIFLVSPFLSGIAIFPAFLLGFFIFLIYNRTPIYRKLHSAGVWPFSAALGAYFAGAIVGWGAVLFAAAFSVTQWSPSF